MSDDETTTTATTPEHNETASTTVTQINDPTEATQRDESAEIPHWEKPPAQRWDEDVEHGGILYSTGCDELGPFDDESGPLPRDEVAGWLEVTEGLSVLAHLVGDFKVRGGLEHLPLRSREFIEQVSGGLGVLLYEIVDRIGELEEDLTNVADEHVPGPPHYARIARRERAQATADAAKVDAEKAATPAPADIKAEPTIEAAAKEMWRVDFEEHSMPYARGQMPCDCAGAGCEDCVVERVGGTPGKRYPEEGRWTLGDVASNVAGDLENAMARVSDLVGAFRGAQERHAAGKPLLDTPASDAVPLVAALEALGIEVARAAILAEKIAEAQEPIEENDPRRLALENEKAERAADACAPLTALHVEGFDEEGLERLYRVVDANRGVARISMSPAAFAAYSAVRDASVDEKLRGYNGGTLPTVHLVERGE